MTMGDVTLRSFVHGERVTVFDRRGDLWPGESAMGAPVKSATVGPDGVVFKGLADGRYWAVAESGHAAFTAKPSASSRTRSPAPRAADPQLTPRASYPYEIHTGATGTKVAGRLVETPLPKHLDEAHPHLNQASVGASVPQRSSTALGQATPVDPAEPQPKPRQEDVKPRVRQMSATATGEATPIVGDAGPAPQDEAKRRLKQRSDTEEGEQTPLGSAEPRGSASNPDAREQAAGVRPTDTRAQVRVRAKVKTEAASKVKKP